MKIRIFIFASLFLIASLTLIACSPWISAKPVTVENVINDNDSLKWIPPVNISIMKMADSLGPTIAPTYETAVCTEYLIGVLNKIHPLTKKQMNIIRIVDHDTLELAIAADAANIRGVQTALVNSKLGTAIDDPEDVRPGDLVQFWNVSYRGPRGHCGIVLDLEPDRYITMMSSSTRTDGHGIQTFWWPEKTYFVRMN
jgi:hypothetical protein